MAYDKTTWVERDEITSTRMNKLEDGVYDVSEQADTLESTVGTLQADVETLQVTTSNFDKVAYGWKGTSQDLLIEWATISEVLSVRFYGGTVTILTGSNYYPSLALSGAVLPFVDGNFICVNLTNPSQPTVQALTVTTIDDVPENVYIVGRMNYLSGVEAITFLTGGTLSNTTSGTE